MTNSNFRPTPSMFTAGLSFCRADVAQGVFFSRNYAKEYALLSFLSGKLGT